MSEEFSKEKYYAKATQPLPEAAIHGLFRFATEKQALERLQDFRKTFHLSKEQPTAKKGVRLWIADYAVTAQEIEQGYCGHYAVISVKALEGGQFTLIAKKDAAPVSTHPHKKFPTRKHPGWSHPIMRAIKRGKVFKSEEVAQEVLSQLHAEYPETSVPGLGKLNLIVYEVRKTGEPPTRKYILSIQPQEKGFILKPERVEEVQAAKKAPPKEKKGYYTAMVEEKRAKKKRSDVRQKKAKPAITRKPPPPKPVS